MEWEYLLSKNRLGQEDTEPRDWSNYPINTFEKDYNKIVSSAAFRRLQDKTQVSPWTKAISCAPGSPTPSRFLRSRASWGS